ncbi:hypothetical protein GQ53DRAFT_766099 [Thozetella sp. PMI_491]|nr:hypothetical protein GQ53DRAFT_766099 [Thozetella sp. PMI_491]
MEKERALESWLWVSAAPPALVCRCHQALVFAAARGEIGRRGENNGTGGLVAAWTCATGVEGSPGPETHDSRGSRKQNQKYASTPSACDRPRGRPAASHLDADCPLEEPAAALFACEVGM